MDKEFYESLRFKRGIEKVVKELNYNFEMKSTLDGLPNRNITMMFINDKTDNPLDVMRFFNAIENTKVNMFKSIEEILDKSSDTILPNIQDDDAEKEVSSMFNPYHYDSRYVHIENIFFRIGSIWDQLAHICNVHYNLKIDIKKVSANTVFKKKYANQIMNKDNLVSKVETYFNEINSFFDFNIHEYIIDFRNKLIHYGDFNSLKFASNYMNDSIQLTTYPFGYILATLMVDIYKCLFYVKNMYDEFTSKFDKHK